MAFILRIYYLLKYNILFVFGRIQLKNCRVDIKKENIQGLLYDISPEQFIKLQELRAEEYFGIFIDGSDTGLRVAIKPHYPELRFIGLNRDLLREPVVTENSTPMPKFSKKAVVLYVMTNVGFYIPRI
jgi:hypothetical protein